MGEFRHEKVGITFSVFQFIIESWTTYIVITYLLEAAMLRTEALCSQGNFCSAFGLLLSHTIIALLVVAIVPLRFKATIDCFNQVNYILYNQKYKKSISVTYFTMLPFAICIMIKIIISKIGFSIREPELYYLYNVAYFGPIIIINVVAVLCLIAEEAYREINEELNNLCNEYTNSKYRNLRIKYLMNHHWYITDFVEKISKCFSVDILLVMIDIYIQLVLFLYVTLWSMFAQKIFSGFIWPHVAGLLEVIIILVKLIYLCYRCDRAVFQVWNKKNC
ncbi:hypothetical protein PGB90_000395 [Kerria lacca]